MFNSPFAEAEMHISNMKKLESADVIFVADAFLEDYRGGAELSTEALFKSAVQYDVNVAKIKSSEVNMAMLEQHFQKYWVFFNIASLNWELIPTIITNLDYTVVEYDFKYCKWRSPEKHAHVEGSECDCNESTHGKLYSSLLYGAKQVMYMSEAQKQLYESKFEFLANSKSSYVLSSVFDEEFFVKLAKFRENSAELERNDKWLVLASPSWIKGYDDSIKVCKQKGYDYEEVWGLSYDEMLAKLATSKGLLFHPAGGDTCPRIVIEAKAFGCELDINENVMHKDEEWFTGSVDQMVEYLYASRNSFWEQTKNVMNYVPTISGYTTTYNCNQRGYPWRESIESLLDFCDEVVVLDAGSDDGTWNELETWAEKEEKLVIAQNLIDWNSSDFAPQSDGMQKSRARAMCTKEFCWQQDVDELVPFGSRENILKLCKNFPVMVDVFDLPVVEYWGSRDKVRVDIMPWKWRVSRNKEHIVHGIPVTHRLTRDDGTMYSRPGSDSCNYIHKESGEELPHMGFYQQQVDNARLAALQGNEQALAAYQEWYQKAIDSLPYVVHYSWLDIGQKMRAYRDYWSTFWTSMYGANMDDTAENNMFFNKPWSEVTEEEIDQMANKLATEMGGWIFHSKVDFSQKTPHVTLKVKDNILDSISNEVASV